MVGVLKNKPTIKDREREQSLIQATKTVMNLA